MKRRKFISSVGKGTGAMAVLGTYEVNANQNAEDNDSEQKINHSVCHWCYEQIPLEEFLPIIKAMGFTGIDLIGPKDWPLLKEHGVHCAMCNGAEISLTEGWANVEHHEVLLKNYRELIPKVAAAGYQNLICFSGNRNGMEPLVGLENCVTGLKQVIPLAEQHGVVLQMELFNQINHPDYLCDNTLWGVELCKRLNSESFKLLYDIYHMQIQEGDIIRTIEKYHPYLGHYHTAGVPGRHEIDESQELYYPAIMRAIAETGFKGYVAQEFIPTWEEPLKALEDAKKRCDV